VAEAVTLHSLEYAILSSREFYANLEAFDRFSGIADLDNYRRAPDDWHVVIADVVSSTAAIAQGRYKDVNMIGAACINAVLNISQKKTIPYVFGGDGATLMVPPDRLQHATDVLLGVRDLAAAKFDLILRVGVVPVADIHSRSKVQVRVGKYRLSPGNELGVFSGGGIEVAEKWVKSGSDYLLQHRSEEGSPDLSGLSCRWEPLASQNGTMLSLLMQARAGDEASNASLYRNLIEDIEAITDSVGEVVKPVSDANMKFRWPPRGIGAEIKATVGERNRSLYGLQLYFNSLVQWCLDRFDITAGGYRGRSYRGELRDNTDYQRFDDTLRILLDCSAQQAQRIDTLLQSLEKRGELTYGLHRSDSALMTCLVFNLDKGEHIHFVDGSDGGFTAAAKNMKAKRQSA
jgi:hypothetical protein